MEIELTKAQINKLKPLFDATKDDGKHLVMSYTRHTFITENGIMRVGVLTPNASKRVIDIVKNPKNVFAK